MQCKYVFTMVLGDTLKGATTHKLRATTHRLRTTGLNLASLAW